MFLNGLYEQSKIESQLSKLREYVKKCLNTVKVHLIYSSKKILFLGDLSYSNNIKMKSSKIDLGEKGGLI